MRSVPPDADQLNWRMLLAGYASGVFPMADSRDVSEVYWVEPKLRAILPLDGFRLSRSLAKRLRSGAFEIRHDTAFAATVAACAAPGPGREDSWINAGIEAGYARLFERGYAHSVEAWRDGVQVGGLYGVTLGRAFFGESMFSHATDASKTALAWLMARLIVGGFDLLDCQFMTPHLASLGAIELPQAEYLRLLYPSVAGAFSSAAGGAGVGEGDGAGVADGRDAGAGRRAAVGDWGALDALLAGSDDTSISPGQRIVQLLTNTS